MSDQVYHVTAAPELWFWEWRLRSTQEEIDKANETIETHEKSGNFDPDIMQALKDFRNDLQKLFEVIKTHPANWEDSDILSSKDDLIYPAIFALNGEPTYTIQLPKGKTIVDFVKAMNNPIELKELGVTFFQD